MSYLDKLNKKLNKIDKTQTPNKLEDRQVQVLPITETAKKQPSQKEEEINKSEETVSKSKSTISKKNKEETTKNEDSAYVSIKDWAEDDRPREKLRTKGKHALSNAELIAILLGSGSRKISAVQLAKEILKSADNNLNELGKISIDELIKNFHGVGEAKAITIAAAMELGRRRKMSAIKDRPEIRGSQDAYNIIAPMLADLHHEEFWILMLNRGNQVLKRVQVSLGGVSGTVVDAKIIFKRALEIPASAIILCHNHPSGNLRPSMPDIEITKKIKAGAELIDIKVLDHLIVSERGYFSFADEGMM
ncbi:MAG: DNA repair protein RadC [Saprospiraceae bacterium]